MKRFLYIFITVAAIILVGLVGYVFLNNWWQAPSAQSPGGGSLPGASNQTNTAQNQTPSSAQQTPVQPVQVGLPSTSGTFGLIAKNQALDFFVTKQNDIIMIGLDGQVVKVTSGQSAVINSSPVTGLFSAQFSYDGQKILALFGDPTQPQASVFDIASKSWLPLSGVFRGATWSPSSYQIAFLKDGVNDTSLDTLDVSNGKAKPRELLRIHEEDVTLKWTKTNQIILSGKESSAIATSIWSFDTKTQKFTKLAGEILGLEATWNATGSGAGVLFEASRTKHGGILSLVDALGNSLTNLRLATLPIKCLFGEESMAAASSSSKPTMVDMLYCGVPRDTQTFLGANLPDDYLKKQLFTADDIYKVNVATGDASLVWSDAGQMFDVSDMKLFGSNLFFVNRIDQKVYAVALK